MSNDYFTKTGNPQTNSAGSSSLIRAEFANTEAGFDKLAPLTGNGNKVVVINAGGTGQTSIARAALLDTTITDATAKTTPVDADVVPLVDSAASNVLKKLSWANIKATLKTWIEGTSFSAFSTSGQITSTVSTGTAPLVIASTTKVANLNVDQLDGGDWAAPGAIGSTTPNTGAFTTLSASVSISSVAPNVAGVSAVSARYNASNGKLGFTIANANGYPALTYNANSKTSVDTMSYDIAGFATQLRLDSGQFAFDYAASGTAGADISWSRLATLSSTGLSVTGALSASGDFSVTGAAVNAYFNSDTGAMRWRTAAGVEKGAIRIATNDLKIEDAGGTERLRIVNGSGVSVTGALSATGTLQTTNTADSTNLGIGALQSSGGLSVAKTIWTGGSQFNSTATTDYEMVHRGAGGWWFYTDSATKIPLKIERLAPTNACVISSTGLSVTGALSATGNITVNGGNNLQMVNGSGNATSAIWNPGATGVGEIAFGYGSEWMRLAAGNLGLGVTPSAWSMKAMQLGGAGAISGDSNTIGLSQNVRGTLYSGFGAAYIEGGFYALTYELDRSSGSHKWKVATQGTNAGDPITFTQALTLEAAGHLLPGTTDNVENLGSATYRWATVYAGTGTINTSDAREKTEVSSLTAAEINAAKQLSKEIGTYKFLASIQAKGDAARTHIGMTVQRAIEIMEANGLDPFGYGFICHDVWDDKFVEHLAVEAVAAQEAVLDDDGNVVTPAVEAVEGKAAWTEQTQVAGDRYAFRYDQLNLFIAAGIEARLAALEAA